MGSSASIAKYDPRLLLRILFIIYLFICVLFYKSGMTT